MKRRMGAFEISSSRVKSSRALAKAMQKKVVQLMINGESVLFGGIAIATMWKLSTITRRGENRYEQI
jgi:hypothetical protein